MSYNSSNELASTKKYYDISNNISKREKFNDNDDLVDYRIYNFDDNDCGFISLYYYNPDDSINYLFTYDYIDENCSMTTTRTNSNYEIINYEEYIRDNMQQSRKSTLIDFFRADNLGNTIKYTIWDENDNINTERSFESVFQYNSGNYPITEIRTYVDSTVENLTFEYY